MVVHDLGVKTKRPGGDGTVHQRSVEDCLDRLATETNSQVTALIPVDELTLADFEGGLTIAAINRCLDDAEVIVRELNRDDLDESSSDTPTFPIVLDALTLRISLTERDDSPDVIRAVQP